MHLSTTTPELPDAVSTETVTELALGLGIDAVGVTTAEPYERAEREILERLARGLYADLKFTMTRTERSAHPQRVVEGAVSVISVALSYWRPETEPPLPPGADPAEPTPSHGRIGRYTRFDAYDALRTRLQTMADWLQAQGFAAKALVDENEHIDQAAAVRSGLGFAGKHTIVITRRHGSWVVLGTIITSAPLTPTEPMRPGCGSCTACIDACPTDAIIDGGHVLDTTRCISYWAQSRHTIPTDIREQMADMVYGCDICQDACPWNASVPKRASDAEPLPFGVNLVDWLQASDDQLRGDYERFYVPRRDPRYLRRNALIALGNTGSELDAALAAPYLTDDDAMLREHAAWALRRIGGPIAAAALHAAGA
jgi:epoxyqueuosine reductase